MEGHCEAWQRCRPPALGRHEGGRNSGPARRKSKLVPLFDSRSDGTKKVPHHLLMPRVLADRWARKRYFG